MPRRSSNRKWTGSSYGSTLDGYYREVKSLILDKQHPVTGLLPASTAVTSHGNYRDAWVRDNVYSILAVWGLALAYRALEDGGGRGYELEHRTVHLMRGLLRSMMAQASKVEAFKYSRDPKDALHAKYDTETGPPSSATRPGDTCRSTRRRCTCSCSRR